MNNENVVRQIDLVQKGIVHNSLNSKKLANKMAMVREYRCHFLHKYLLKIQIIRNFATTFKLIGVLGNPL